MFQKSECCVCQIELSVLKMRKSYHCKICMLNVCSSCSQNRLILHNFTDKNIKDPKATQRVCDLCFKDQEICITFINENKLQWAQHSQLCSKWLGKSKVKLQPIPSYIPDLESIKKDVETGRSDGNVFNYSLAEFFARIQKGKTVYEVRQDITQVLTLMVVHNPIVGYCQGMNQIAAFLLCVADVQGAFQLMAHLFDKIVPPRFYSGNSGTSLIGFQGEQSFLTKVINSRYNYSYIPKLKSFLEIYGPQYLLTLLLQNFNASCVLITWGEMFRVDNFIMIDKAMIHVLDVCKDMELDKPMITEQIQRKIKAKDLKKYLNQKDELIDFERKILIEQFFAETSRRWVEDEKQILFRLKKITQFEIDEIKSIQEVFKKYCLDASSIQQVQVVVEEDDGNLTGSSDDDHHRNSEAQMIHQTKLFKYGIDKQTFIKLMNTFHQNYNKYQSLSEKQYLQIFDLYDENHTSLLDFREFLTCLSILTRGSFEQKLKMFFSAHKKKRINHMEFLDILGIIFDLRLQNSREYKDFLERMVKQQEYTYLDIARITQDQFILQEQQRVRQQTCIVIANSLKQITQG
ncbi:hypothetical protein pb186bvf_005946 [Paramecium bursaria]